MNKIRSIKKIRRQCMVRGCKNKDTYNVSCLTEVGFSVIICEECAKGIVDAIKEKYPTVPMQEEKTKRTRKKANESGE